MSVPQDCKYTKDHEWVKITGAVVTVGITEYAQKELGDIVFVELPEAGDAVEQFSEMTAIESVKAASDLFSPVTGTIIEGNAALEDAPELVNTDPFGEGWIVKVELEGTDQLDALMSAEAYEKLIAG